MSEECNCDQALSLKAAIESRAAAARRVAAHARPLKVALKKLLDKAEEIEYDAWAEEIEDARALLRGKQ